MYEFESPFEFGDSAASTALYIPYPQDCRTCNLCLNHCPTYAVAQRHEESPQGRLQLFSQILSGGLKDGQTLPEPDLLALDHCIECRACEKVCPSKMSYRELLDTVRAKLPERHYRISVRALRFLTRRQARVRLMSQLLNVYQRLGIRALVERIGFAKGLGLERLKLRRLSGLLPRQSASRSLPKPYPAPRAPTNRYPAQGIQRGSLALFSGCLGSAFDAEALQATIQLLTRLGYEVLVPTNQQCCGAIHAHNGDPESAAALLAENRAVFDALDVEAVLYTASGCGAHLAEQESTTQSEPGQQAAAQRNSSGPFRAPVLDINRFIAELDWPSELELRPRKAKVVVHEPCSQQFPVQTNQHAYRFLERIPGLALEPMAENNLCCGAGGTFMLNHPEMSDAVRDRKLAALQDDAQLMVTSNLGCALHLAAGLRAQGRPLAVLHPVQLLAEQLPD